MHRTRAIQVKDVVFDTKLQATMRNAAGQLAPSSRKTYTIDAKRFVQWMEKHSLSLSFLCRDDLIEYQTHLAHTYAVSTASHMLDLYNRAEQQLVDDITWIPLFQPISSYLILYISALIF